MLSLRISIINKRVPQKVKKRYEFQQILLSRTYRDNSSLSKFHDTKELDR